MRRQHGNKRRAPGTVHETLKLAIEQTPGGQASAADALGSRWSPERLYDATNPDRAVEKAARVYLDEARAWTRAFPGKVIAFAQDFALLAGGFFVPPMDAEAGHVGAQAARAGRENAEALQRIYEALADGVLTPGEAKDAMVEVRQSIEATTALYRLLAEIAGVDPAKETAPA